MNTTPERTKTGTRQEFWAFTIAVARGERTVDPNKPKIWIERRDGNTTEETAIRQRTRGLSGFSWWAFARHDTPEVRPSRWGAPSCAHTTQ